MYDRFIIDNPPQDAHEALKLHNRLWNVALRTSLAADSVKVTYNDLLLAILGRALGEHPKRIAVAANSGSGFGVCMASPSGAGIGRGARAF